MINLQEEKDLLNTVEISARDSKNLHLLRDMILQND